jgi:hypothetical protein
MIQDRNVDPSGIGTDKIQFPYIVSGKHTDGSLPTVTWVAKGGADASGATGVSHIGSRKDPFLTVGGANGALRYTIDGRGDRVIVGPGTWRENLDFGSGTGTTGSAGRMNKRDIGLYGSGGAHPGRTQIVGDGTTTGPTIRVRDGYLRGFILADLEVGSVDSADADRAQPLIDLETVDAATTLTATSSDEWAVLKNVRLDGGAVATAGLVFTGAQQVQCYNLEVAGCLRGIVLRSSSVNLCDNLRFWDTEYHDNVTADIATSSNTEGQWVFVTGGATTLTNIKWVRNHYMDRGGTPVTNYVNAGAAGVSNVMDFDFFAARDVADDTLMILPVDWIAIGRDAAGAQFTIGA